MDVMIIESEAFKRIVSMFETTLKLITDQHEELKKLKDNRLMSIKEASEYTGFGTQWINSKKEEIGYFQAGAKDIKIYKEDIDKYFREHRVQKKK